MSFNYKHFIDEITASLNQVKTFLPKDWDSDEFRKWRHKLLDSIYRIERQGYSINCNLSTRQFHIFGYGGYSKSEQDNLFKKHIADTVSELELIIEQYKNYGEPLNKKLPSINDSAKALGKEMPEKITLRWLIDHMPIQGWIAFISFLIGAFGIGYGFHAAITPPVENRAVLIVPTVKQDPSSPLVRSSL